MITRETMDLEEPTRLRNIFHATEAPHSHQRIDRCDERLVVLSEEQLDISNDFTTAFLVLRKAEYREDAAKVRSPFGT